MNSLHEMCPEERTHIGEKSLSFCNMFLEEMSKEARNIVHNICEQQCLLSDKLRPKQCARLIHDAMQQKNSGGGGKRGGGDKKGAAAPMVAQMPGDESYRKCREDMTL